MSKSYTPKIDKFSRKASKVGKEKRTKADIRPLKEENFQYALKGNRIKV